MRRREFVGGVAAWLLAARAQAKKIPRIGYLWSGLRDGDLPNAGLRQGLADRGYGVGRDVIIDERSAEGDPTRLPALVAELLALNLDVLATPGTISALAARKATSTVPIVCTSADPIGAGLAVSLARPGGNVTGVSLLSGDYSSKWLELLMAAVPKLRRVAVLSNPGNMAMQLEMSRLNQAAIDLNLTLKRLSVLPDDLEASLAEISAARFDGLIVTDDSIVLSMTRRIVEIAARERIPALFGVHTAAQMGGLMSYSVNLFDLWRRAAGYVDRILKGAKPGELPIEQATKITLAINLKTARALDLEIPPSLLAAADEVIE